MPCAHEQRARAAHTNAELVFDQLANGTDATVAKVVNVITSLDSSPACTARRPKSCDNVLFGKDTNICRKPFKLLKLIL